MDALTLPQIVYFCIVLILSYAVRGSAGFGGVTVPLLALVLSLKIVVPMVTFLGLLSSLAILARDYRHVAWRDTLKILPYSLAGVLIGLYFFKTLDARTLAHALGVIVLAYGGHSLWVTVRPGLKWRPPAHAVTPVAGTVAGFVGTIFGSMAGMFYAIYLDLLKLGKNEFRATVAAILLALGLFRGVGYAMIGAFDRDALIACGAALPLMAAGVFLGNHIHANLNPLAFKRLVALILIASGAPLLLR
ncbi:MAG TPA: sulfite exporter TauE/SafE family protein [Burkholderiales bacterium]|nr:sulfite exporter TauE/SafE family protein [Burkholderiales bacterium]